MSLYFHILRVDRPGHHPKYFQKRQSDGDTCYRLLRMQDLIIDYHRLFGLPLPTFTLSCYQVPEKELAAEQAIEQQLDEAMADRILEFKVL